MYAVVHSATVVGVDALPVRVEAFLTSGLPSFTVVGLPGVAVRESRERVRAALKQLGLPLPPSRIVVNLAPADLRKEGPAFDLPIALALLAADRRLPLRALEGVLAFGELALDGSLRPVRGAVSIALLAASQGPGSRLLTPPGNAHEATLVPGATAYAPATLAAAVAHLTGRTPLPPVRQGAPRAGDPQRAGGNGQSPYAPGWYGPGWYGPDPRGLDLADVQGQVFAKRALEVAAAGRHNVLLTGPPGAGKTMLALRLPGILPPLTTAEAVEVSRVHSSAGLLPNGAATGLPRTPPLRQPHHSGTPAGILGGGAVPRPGDVSLAHHGVLFLDELPEFRSAVLEALRQPLEEGHVTISRASGSVHLPARFQLVAARNPCPCGLAGAAEDGAAEGCSCNHLQILRYQRKLSGPFLDRIDLRLNVPRLTESELTFAGAAEGSRAVAERVARARAAMLERQGCANAHLGVRALARHARVDAHGKQLLAELAARGRLSGRGFDRLLRVARTVADLEGSGPLEVDHLAEAAAYRPGP